MLTTRDPESTYAARAITGGGVAGADRHYSAALESFRQFDQIKALAPSWPVSVAVAGLGHARAQNRPDT
jgi:hypothetical protein